MSIETICSLVVAVCTVLGLIGGAIWAITARFATKSQTQYLNGVLEGQKKEMAELKELFNTHISNEAYYRKHIEEQKKTLDQNQNIMSNVDGLFRDIKTKLDTGKLKVV